MAVEDFGGKVLGKPIEAEVADHQNKPDTASALARKWFDVDKVDMIANLINSSIALSVSQLAKEKNRIAIINGSGSHLCSGSRYWVSPQTTLLAAPWRQTAPPL